MSASNAISLVVPGSPDLSRLQLIDWRCELWHHCVISYRLSIWAGDIRGWRLESHPALIFDAKQRDKKVNNEIVGRGYVAIDAPSTVWVVTEEVEKGMKTPHARLLKSGEPGTTKLIALNALMDQRLYRQAD